MRFHYYYFFSVRSFADRFPRLSRRFGTVDKESFVKKAHVIEQRGEEVGELAALSWEYGNSGLWHL
jgi:hypothetical protein